MVGFHRDGHILHKSECSIRVLMTVLLEYIDLNALKIFVCLHLMNLNICFTPNNYDL